MCQFCVSELEGPTDSVSPVLSRNAGAAAEGLWDLDAEELIIKAGWTSLGHCRWSPSGLDLHSSCTLPAWCRSVSAVTTEVSADNLFCD